jgi:hypothetical protein
VDACEMATKPNFAAFAAPSTTNDCNAQKAAMSINGYYLLRMPVFKRSFALKLIDRMQRCFHIDVL